MIDRDTNVEYAVAMSFINGNKSVLKDEINNRTPMEAAQLVLAVVEELEAISDLTMDDVQNYLEAL